MNRLTMWYDGNHAICENEECSSGDCPFADPICEQVQNIIDRLAAIEDILGDEYDLDRLRELAQADREGKVPKYTIGDTVYDSFGNAWEVTAVDLHSMRTKNEWLYRCGHEGIDDYCALWYFEEFPSKEAALRREQVGGRGRRCQRMPMLRR